MADYRAYIVGPSGTFVGSRNFACDTDEHAVEWAKQLLEDRPIELWSNSRMVSSLSPVQRRKAVSHEIKDGCMLPKGSN